MRWLLAVTTCGAADYVEHTLRSLAAETALDYDLVVIDDASVDVPFGEIIPRLRGRQSVLHQLKPRAGLLRSWNKAASLAIDGGYDAFGILNSDLAFLPGWDRYLEDSLAEFDFVGPVTNAPGPDIAQHVSAVLPIYRFPFTRMVATDWQAMLNRRPLSVRPGKFNGFAFFGKVASLKAAMYDKVHAFRPSNPVNSRGARNPTPHMTLGEYEFQARAHSLGLRTGILDNSFVVHFRSASRGAKHRKGDAFELKDWAQK